MASQRVVRERLGWRLRAGLVALALCLAGLLGLARWLTPDPRGYGTHEQLGLGPCSFAHLTGEPCPACGMTTAFAWCMRGRPEMAWRANPASFFLVPACLVLIPWLIFSAAIGRAWGFRSVEVPLVSLVVASASVSVLVWSFRLLLRRVL